MQITGKMLLSSAEGILRERQEEARKKPASSVENGTAKAASPESGIAQDQLHVRLLHLQDRLNRVQREYSREQARSSNLSSLQADDNSRGGLPTFENEPLFSEAEREMDGGILKNGIGDRLQVLSRNLKGIQVEMENLYALNFKSMPKGTLDSANLLQSGVINPLDPERVARLTRQDG